MAGQIWQWSTTASSNASADSDMTWAENMAPKLINDNVRVMMKRIADLLDDLACVQITGGSANAYSLNLQNNPASYTNGLIFGMQLAAGVTNTGASTLTVNSIGAKPIYRSDRVAVNAGDLRAHAYYLMVYDSNANGGNGAFIAINLTPTNIIYFGDGTAAAPSVTCVDFQTTGFYWIDANTIGVTFQGQAATVLTGNGSALTSNPVSRIGLGTLSPAGSVHVKTQASNVNLQMEQYLNGGNNNVISFDTYNGTIAGATAMAGADNRVVGRVRWRHADSTVALAESARIGVNTEGATTGAGNVPARMIFSTCTTGGTLTEALRIDSAQHLVIAGDTGTYIYQSSGGGANTLSLGLNSYEAWRFTTTGVGFRSGTGTPVTPIAAFYSQQTTQPAFYAECYSITGANSAIIKLAKSNNAALGSAGLVSSGDSLGQIIFSGSDNSTGFNSSSKIEAQADAGGNASRTPGRLVFSTTTSGSVMTEAFRIDAAQNMAFGGDFGSNPYIFRQAAGTLSFGFSNLEQFRFSGGNGLRYQQSGTIGAPVGTFHSMQSQQASFYADMFSQTAGDATTLRLTKTNASTVGGNGAQLSTTDNIAQINFGAGDGLGGINTSARIAATVDGNTGTTPSARLVFSTATSAGSLTEAMRINKTQQVSLSGNTNSYWSADSANQFDWWISSKEALQISSTRIMMTADGSGTGASSALASLAAVGYQLQGSTAAGTILGLFGAATNYFDINFYSTNSAGPGGQTRVGTATGIGRVRWLTTDGTTMQDVGRIAVFTDTVNNAGSLPTNMRFYTCKSGATTTNEVLRLGQDGTVSIFGQATLDTFMTSVTAGGLAITTGGGGVPTAVSNQADDLIICSTTHVGITLGIGSNSSNGTINFMRNATTANTTAGQIKYASASGTTGSFTFSAETDINITAGIVTAGGNVNLTAGSSGDIVSTTIGASTAGAGTTIQVDASNRIRKLSSSRRYKTDIRTMGDDVLDMAENLRPVLFKSTCRGDDPNQDLYGFIAEEVEDIGLIPLVNYREIDGKVVPEALAYSNLTAVLFGLYKREKSARLALEDRLSRLEAKLNGQL